MWSVLGASVDKVNHPSDLQGAPGPWRHAVPSVRSQKWWMWSVVGASVDKALAQSSDLQEVNGGRVVPSARSQKW